MHATPRLPVPVPAVVRVHVVAPGAAHDLSVSGRACSLSADERLRAARLVHPADQAAWVCAHAQLRAGLTELQGQQDLLRPVPASDWRFIREAGGKPAIESDQTLLPIEFSLSHCRTRVVVAIGTTGPLGIDVEPWDTDLPDAWRVAREVFTPRERDWLAQGGAVDSPGQRRRFFALWTAKEAWLKALGTGLSFPLERLEAQPEAGLWRVQQADGRWQVDERWTMRAWDCGAHVVTLAVPRGSPTPQLLWGDAADLMSDPCCRSRPRPVRWS